MNIRPFTGTSRTATNEKEPRSISNSFLGKIMTIGKERRDTRILEEIRDIHSDLERYAIWHVELMSPKNFVPCRTFKSYDKLIKV